MKIYLLTGGNLGNRHENLQFAIRGVEKKIGVITRKSAVYETSAWGITEQPAFLNQVLEIETNLDPLEILEKTQQIERQAGRTRHQKWQARTLDIDILFIDHQVISSEKLIIPHPHLQDRNFVLVPLAELIPDFEHPICRQSVQSLLAHCVDRLAVHKMT